MVLKVVDILCIIAIICFVLCFNIGSWRHLSKLRRNNYPHVLSREDFKLDHKFATVNQMSDKLTEFSKDLLIYAFQKKSNLDRIEEFMVRQMEAREGGKWICLIHVHDTVFKLSFRCPKELYMTIEKDELKVILAQTQEMVH